MIAAAQMAVLLLVGGAMLRASLDGTYLFYVKPGLQPFLIAAALVFLLLGIRQARWVFLPGGQGNAEPAVACSTGPGTDPAHAAGHVPRVAWLLALPVLVTLVVAPAPLGSYAAERESGVLAEPAATDYPPLHPGDPAPLTLSEYGWRAVYDAGRTLRGRTVELTGFASPREGGGWYLTRMVLNCCAADGRAVKVEIRDARSPGRDAWVSVTGRYAPGDPPDPAAADPNFALPVLAAESVRPIQAPAQPYEAP